MREDFVHLYIREHLKKNQWTLISGEYPNGSDDELYPLYVKDPEVARDNSPDPRRHSNNKLVPDLISYKNNILLVIEIKPKYSLSDETKLDNLLTERINDFKLSMIDFLNRYFSKLEINIESCQIVPCLGFASKSRYCERNDFAYIVVEEDSSVQLLMPKG